MAEISGGYRKIYHLDLLLNEDECLAFMNLMKRYSNETVDNSSTNNNSFSNNDHRLFYCIYCELSKLTNP